MASTISLLPEKHFLCSLCGDIFTSPVTTPCGHSFCSSCLCQYWTRHQSKYCPSCRRLFSDRPDLSVNYILAELSDNYRKDRSPASQHLCPFAVWCWRLYMDIFSTCITHNAHVSFGDARVLCSWLLMLPWANRKQRRRDAHFTQFLSSNFNLFVFSLFKAFGS